MGRRAVALAAIESVLPQLAEVSSELLVLDNGCDVELQRAVDQLARRAGGEVRYYEVRDVGLHNGRHAAARNARGELLAYLDDDVLVRPGWLAAIAEAFVDNDVHLVGGPCRPLYEAEPPNWLVDFWGERDGARICAPLSLIDAGDTARDIDPLLVFGANFAIRKETLQEVGGFHPDALPWSLRRFRGDGESWVSTQIGSLGLRARYHPQAAVLHRVPSERMTDAYFERRGFLQGISDSFTDIRSSSEPPVTERFSSQVRDAFAGVARTLRNLTPTRVHAYEASRLAGYRYHRAQMRWSAVVHEWVLRPDFWSGRVPEDTDS